jgi:hypothetical protein
VGSPRRSGLRAMQEGIQMSDLKTFLCTVSAELTKDDIVINNLCKTFNIGKDDVVIENIKGMAYVYATAPLKPFQSPQGAHEIT